MYIYKCVWIQQYIYIICKSIAEDLNFICLTLSAAASPGAAAMNVLRELLTKTVSRPFLPIGKRLKPFSATRKPSRILIPSIESFIKTC